MRDDGGSLDKQEPQFQQQTQIGTAAGTDESRRNTKRKRNKGDGDGLFLTKLDTDSEVTSSHVEDRDQIDRQSMMAASASKLQ